MEKSGFHLNKWFLDFIGNNGETMIFYAAKLTFKRIAVHYASWIHYNPESGVTTRSHFQNVKLPEKKDEMITWKDELFKVSGSWQSKTTPLFARIFEGEHGHLDWNCFQPASKVQLKLHDKIIEGNGYAEQLILTTLPWHIPMDELRWGRFHAPEETVVWIELRKTNKQQWLWLNGEKLLNCSIEDDCIESQEKDFVLKLDRGVVIESEKKIFQVVEKRLRFIPGFKQLMPVSFLMAQNYKWLSKGDFQRKGKGVVLGTAIHEWVNFNAE